MTKSVKTVEGNLLGKIVTFAIFAILVTIVAEPFLSAVHEPLANWIAGTRWFLSAVALGLFVVDIILARVGKQRVFGKVSFAADVEMHPELNATIKNKFKKAGSSGKGPAGDTTVTPIRPAPEGGDDANKEGQSGNIAS